MTESFISRMLAAGLAYNGTMSTPIHFPALLSLLLLLSSGACVSPSVQHQHPNYDLRVTISPSSDSAALLAEFTLTESAIEFSFETVNSPQRRSNWTVENSNWDFDGESISRTDGRLFERFTLRLSVDARFFNRRYVAVDRIGNDSWTLLLSAFAPAAGVALVDFDGFDKFAIVRNGDRTIRATGARLLVESDEHLVYVGSSRHVQPGIPNVTAGPEVPSWLHSHLGRTLVNVVDRSTERFGVGPLTQPSVYLTSHPDSRGNNWKGGALDNGVTAIRLRGFDLSEPDDDVIASVTNTMAHEAVHLWIGNRFKNAYNEEQPWLHEGSTEYLADRMRMKSADIVNETEYRLNNCLLSLGDRALDGSRGYVQDQSAYDCGYVINFVSEIASIQAGHGDIAAIWRKILDRSTESGFTTEDFLAVANIAGEEKASTFIGRILNGAGDTRWLNVAKDFDAIGMVVSVRDPDQREGDALRSIFLQPILGSLCNGRYGYTTYDTHIEFDTGDRCGENLIGNPSIARVGDSHIVLQPFQSYRYVRSVCDDGGDLLFWTVEDSDPITLPCESVIEPLPALFELVEVPQLPDL